ncbi:MAG TPA: hypothetical protein PLK99_04245 [Burkholderiales bacterium]|nr:hypothetical protein [Burkholderiales bacterium]
MLPEAVKQQTEEVDMEKLTRVVVEAIGSIANATGLSSNEVMKVIEEVNVATLKDATQHAIRKISVATDLDTEEITDIFTERKAATLDDIVTRLHEKSKADRRNMLAY